MNRTEYRTGENATQVTKQHDKNNGMDESKKIQDRIKDINVATEIDNNERVIFICPGCDSMSKNNADKKCCCNCRVFCRKLTKKVKIFILSAPGLTLLLLSYLMIGAVTFNVLEGGRKLSRGFNLTKTISTHKDDKIKESVERLWKITENLNVLYKENWTKLAGEEITNLQDYFFEELTAKSDNSVISECNTKNYQSNRKKNPPFWNLGECFLYSLSLLTTVGSGNILPRTVWGRVFSVFYITIGFFIMLVYLAVVGDYLASPFRRIYSYVTCQNGKKTATKTVSKCSVPNCNKSATVYHEAYSIPVWLAALVLVFYITSGALTFNLIEKWTLLDSWYFCFMSLVTIGFGGFTPGRMESISMIATSAYILIGMALLSMCFNLIQTDVVMFFRNLYLWSEREDAMNLLSLTRSIPS